MAGCADALKVFAAIGIPNLSSSDQPCRHNVVHMPPDSCLFEIHSACLNLTLPAQSWCPQTPPSFPQRATPRPLPLDTAPANWPLLGTEPRPAAEASTVTIRTATAVHGLEHFCSPVSAKWTTHVLKTSFP